jgi:hypothetical protein
VRPSSRKAETGKTIDTVLVGEGRPSEGIFDFAQGATAVAATSSVRMAASNEGEGQEAARPRDPMSVKPGMRFSIFPAFCFVTGWRVGRVAYSHPSPSQSRWLLLDGYHCYCSEAPLLPSIFEHCRS